MINPYYNYLIGGANKVPYYNTYGNWTTDSTLTWDSTTFNVAGNITASGTILSTSDDRFKTNWKLLPDDYVAKLAKIKSGTYDRIDYRSHQAGVSAQSIREVLPEVVFEDERGKLSVGYGNAAMVSAVELAKEVVAIKETLANYGMTIEDVRNLLSRVVDLEQRVNQLEGRNIRF